MCAVGSALVVFGSYLTWFHIAGGGPGNSTLNVDVYQLSSWSYFEGPLATWSSIAIRVGAIGLLAAGLGTLVFARRIPLFWTSLWIAAASVAAMFGASVAQFHGSVDFPFTPTGPCPSFATSRGPGLGVTLVGAGLGIVSAMDLVLIFHRRS
jgi:hypothetical protein